VYNCIAHNLQLADDTNDENLMKIAIEEFVLLYPHNDPDSILTAFLLYRNTEQFVKMKNRLVYAKQEIPNAKTQQDCAENIVSDCIVRLEKLDMQILNLENALRTLLLNITSEKGALREMKVQLAICKTEKSRLLKEVEKMRIDAKSATAALRTWCRQLAALHAEERKAYGRFWERHGSSSVDDRKRLECDLQAAGNEYIESVFPRMEMVRNYDR
jgi:chromosome segregation ATPase